MAIVSIIGPKGGIGKTTLAINAAAALTQVMETETTDGQVCLVDLDLRLPTVSSILQSHPKLTFFDLFAILANKTCQVDFLRSLYQVVSVCLRYLDGGIADNDLSLQKAITLFKNLNPGLFQFSRFKYGDQFHELFLRRGEIRIPMDLIKLEPVFREINLKEFRKFLGEAEINSQPVVEDYINYIEEYGFSILGGEVPVLGKKEHRKRINEPEFLQAFLDFLNGVFGKFKHVVLDTPAGGVNHISSLMNVIDQVVFVFDLSNPVAVNGSIDALHSFIDYYEDFYKDYIEGKLTGLDKLYVSKLIAGRGVKAVEDSLQNKKMGILMNRYQDIKGISSALTSLRDYLDILDKYEKYKHRIHIMGMIPHHKVINITSHKGTLFYNKDAGLKNRMNMVANNILTDYKECPSLADDDKKIIRYLQKADKGSFTSRLSQIAGSYQRG